MKITKDFIDKLFRNEYFHNRMIEYVKDGLNVRERSTMTAAECNYKYISLLFYGQETGKFTVSTKR